MAAVVVGGIAVLVPASFVEASSEVESRLRRGGFGVVDDGGYWFDPVEGAVVVPPGIAPAGHPALADGLEVSAGRLRVVAAFLGQDEAFVDDSPGQRLVRLLTRVTDRTGLSRSELLHNLVGKRDLFRRDLLDRRPLLALERIEAVLRNHQSGP